MEGNTEGIVTQLDISTLYQYIHSLEERIKFLESITKHLRPN